MDQKTYTALTTIDHDGRRYLAGDPIDLDEQTEAPQLLAVNAIEPAPADADAPAATKSRK